LEAKDGEAWPSVQTNYQAVKEAFCENREAADDVLGCNAIRVLRLAL